MAKIDAGQDYDIIQTLTFEEASGTCNIRLYRGSNSAYSGNLYIRAGTSGGWSAVSVSGENTTFSVTNTTMQVAHNWNKDDDNYMTCSFYYQSTNLTKIEISQKAVLSGVIGDFFMFYYAYGCSSLTSLDAPDTSGITSVGDDFMYRYANHCSSLTSLGIPGTSSLTSVGDYFMYSYADICSSLTSLGVPDTSVITSVGDKFMYRYAYWCNALEKLILPKVGWFADNNIDWQVPSGRLGYLKGYVLNSADLTNWKALTAEGKTLYTNYIRSADNVIGPPKLGPKIGTKYALPPFSY